MAASGVGDTFRTNWLPRGGGRLSHPSSAQVALVDFFFGTAPTITTTTLPDGTVGTAYSQVLAATGNTPITWAVTSGSLPPGLTLASDGTLSGTPTTAGSYSFTVSATNDADVDTQALSITVIAVAVQGVLPGGGGGGRIYWQGKRRKARLEEQPNLHLKKILDDVVRELYGELEDDDVPEKVKVAAAKIVNPYVIEKVRDAIMPPVEAINWSALERDANRVRRIIAMWRKQEIEREIEDEDEFLMLLE